MCSFRWGVSKFSSSVCAASIGFSTVCGTARLLLSFQWFRLCVRGLYCVFPSFQTLRAPFLLVVPMFPLSQKQKTLDKPIEIHENAIGQKPNENHKTIIFQLSQFQNYGSYWYSQCLH